MGTNEYQGDPPLGEDRRIDFRPDEWRTVTKAWIPVKTTTGAKRLQVKRDTEEERN